jgi:hypothetical protein
MVMSFWSYWDAIPRAFSHGRGWAEGQGIWLTIWLSLSAAVVELPRAAARFWRQRAERRAFVTLAPPRPRPVAERWVRAAIEGSIAIGGGVIVLLVIVFIWFVVQDGPNQVNALQRQIDQLKADNHDVLAKSDMDHKSAISGLESQIAEANAKIALLTRTVTALRAEIGDKLRIIWLEPLNILKVDSSFENNILIQFASETQVTVINISFDKCPQNIKLSTPGRTTTLSAIASCLAGMATIKIDRPVLNSFYPLLVRTQSPGPITPLGVSYAH